MPFALLTFGSARACATSSKSLVKRSRIDFLTSLDRGRGGTSCYTCERSGAKAIITASLTLASASTTVLPEERA